MTDSEAAKMRRNGGISRAKALSPSRRSEIAQRAAQARWKGHKSKKHPAE